MLKSSFIFVFFCVFIPVQCSFARNGNESTVIGNTLSFVLQQDSLAKAKIDSLTKALAAQKAKEKTILQKLVQPFKFKANKLAYTRGTIHDYVYKDSAATIKQLANLNTALSKMQTQFVHLDTATKNQLVKLQQKLKEIKLQVHQVDSIAKIVKTSGSETATKPAPVDTPVKEKNKVPVVATENTSQIPKPEDTNAQQKKLNTLRLLYKGPIIITDTTKGKESILIKRLKLSHKIRILGFYADTAHSGLKNFNFKLITTLVYASNQIDGDVEDAGLSTNRPVIDSALSAGCNIVLSIYNDKPESIAKFLNSSNAMTSLIQRTLRLLAESKATGLNINFNGMDGHLNGYFVRFIAALYDAYQATHQKYKISITIPGNDKEVAYDLRALDRFTDSFIVDFSKSTSEPGPLSPLNNGSNNSIESCLSLYLDKGIPASKFILGVSYRGVVWQNTPKKFLHYIAYNSVRANYSDAMVIYNKGESAAQIETGYNRTYIDIWYDDEKTLGEKYDYALKNALGGIAIKSLGDDNGYAELQKELAYKLLKIDTTVVGHILLKYSFGTMLSNFIVLLTENPCGHHIDAMYSHNLLIINILVVIILLISAGVLFYQVKRYGEAWKWRKKLIYFLIGLFIFWTFVFLMWLFFSASNPFFGPSLSKHCITMPFIVLYLILVAGIGVGIFIWWLYKLNNEEDVP
jgi:hypothetical protein